MSSFASMGGVSSNKPHMFLLAVDGNPPIRFSAPTDSVYKYDPELTVVDFEIVSGSQTHLGRFEWEPIYFKYTLTMDGLEIGSGVLPPQIPTDSCWVFVLVVMGLATTLILLGTLGR